MNMKKKVLSAVLAFLMVGTAAPFAAFATDIPATIEPVGAEQTVDVKTKNLFKITTTEDFAKGTMDKLEADTAVGNGAVTLAATQTEGTFTSAIYEVPEFKYMVASWNADTPKDTWVEIKARAYIVGNNQNDWTSWLSWGKWSPYILRRSTDDVDNIAGHKMGSDDGWASMSTDEFSVHGLSGGTKVQLMAVLHRENVSAEAPTLRQISATLQNTNSGKRITPTYAESAAPAIAPNADVMLDTPAYSQMVRDPVIGGSICSPSTISIMLNDRDRTLNILPEEMALNLQDFKYGFGNWAYAVAGAGSYGYEAYAQYADFNIILSELAKGNSVGTSVRYRNDENGANKDNPYLENGAASDTYGHLITLTGYKTDADGNVTHFYSSDTATSNEVTTSGKHRIYKADQLKVAQGAKQLVYIIPAHEIEVNAGNYHTARVASTLAPVEGKKDNYSLMANGSKVALPTNFTTGKMDTLGRGTLAFTVEGFKTQMPEGVAQVEANNTFYYDNISISAEGDIVLPIDTIFKSLNIPANTPKDVTVYAIFNNGTMYKAVLSAQRSVARVIAAPMIDHANNDANVAPRDYAVKLIVGDKINTILVTAGGVPEHTNGANALGHWVGAGIYIPENTNLTAAKYYFGAVPFDGTYTGTGLSADITDADGNKYATFYANVGGDPEKKYITIDWNGDGKQQSYVFDLSEVILSDAEIVDKTANNAFKITSAADFEAGTNSNLKVASVGNGALTLEAGKKDGVFLSPIYSTQKFEYAMTSWNAATPGKSSVEVQARVFAERSSSWSDWYSWCTYGSGIESASHSKETTYVNLATDVLCIIGDSDVANANKVQFKIILHGDENNAPTLFDMTFTYKKHYDTMNTSATWLGDIKTLPASATVEVTPYSGYSYYAGFKKYTHEAAMLMLLNSQGSDLLFEEFVLNGYDFEGGWGNWAFTPSKAGSFAHEGYAQYDATPELVKQAIANGYAVALQVNASRLNGTNKGTNRVIIVYGYETVEDAVTFKCICASGDASELASGAVLFTCTEAELKTAIDTDSSDNARGLMYVVLGKENGVQAFSRTVASYIQINGGKDFAIYTNGVEQRLPQNFKELAESATGGGVIAYTIDGENENCKKLADQKFYYDITVNADGRLTVSDELYAKLQADKKATVYVIVNNGITYEGKLSHYVAPIYQEPTKTETPALSPTIKADGNGNANATIGDADIKSAIKAGGDIVIEPKVQGNTKELGVTLSQNAITAMSESFEGKLVLKLGAAELKLDAKAMKDIAAQCSGKLVVATGKTDDGKTKIILTVDGKDIAVKSGFAVTLPQAATKAGMAVQALNPDGSTRIIAKSKNTANGMTVVINSTEVLTIIDNSKSFTDVKDNGGAIGFVSSHGLFQGTAEGIFDGEKAMSRGMAIAVIGRVEGDVNGSAVIPAKDVDNAAYYANALSWAYTNNITNGKGTGWMPNDSVTCEELVTMLCRYAKALGCYKPQTDAKAEMQGVSEWAKAEMQWANAAGMLKDSNGAQLKLDPKTAISRSGAAQVFQNFIENIILP